MNKQPFSKTTTNYESWWITQFKGATAKDSVFKKIDSLIRETGQNDLPINLEIIAEKIGINPDPIFQNQPYEGALIHKENTFRISLKAQQEIGLSPYWRGIKRMRFSYAHELIHCFTYDFKSLPPQRLSPPPIQKIEEFLCNRGAMYILLPPQILKKYILTGSKSLSESIKIISDKAKVSIQATILEIFESNLLPRQNNVIYMLSLFSKGYRDQKNLKPRNVASIIFDSNNNKRIFLPPNQGIDRVGSKKGRWSLIEFHYNIKDNGSNALALIENEEIVVNNKTFIISGVHSQIPNSKYVWSELCIKDSE